MPKHRTTLQEKLNEALGHEVHVDFIPFNNFKKEGTGRQLPRLLGSGQRRTNPLSPAGGNYYQCIHVDSVKDQSGKMVDHVRCADDAKVAFLCLKHDARVFRQPKVQVPVRDYYAEHVDGIIKHEQRAMDDPDHPVRFIRTSCKGDGIEVWSQSDEERMAWLEHRVSMREDSIKQFLAELEAEEAMANTIDALV